VLCPSPAFVEVVEGPLRQSPGQCREPGAARGQFGPPRGGAGEGVTWQPGVVPAVYQYPLGQSTRLSNYGKSPFFMGKQLFL